MVAITTRAAKGSALTNAEVDANFNNLKAAAEGIPPTATRTAAFTLAQTDAGMDIPVDSATGVTATVQLASSVPIAGPFLAVITQLGAGVVTVSEIAGVVIEPAGKRKTGGPGTSLGLRWISTNRWQIVGAKS